MPQPGLGVFTQSLKPHAVKLPFLLTKLEGYPAPLGESSGIDEEATVYFLKDSAPRGLIMFPAHPRAGN